MDEEQVKPRYREHGRLFPWRDEFYCTIWRKKPPPWGGLSALWGVMKSVNGQYKSIAGETQYIKKSTLYNLAAFYFVKEATGQSISEEVAIKIAHDPDFDYRSMSKQEMTDLYIKHAKFDFS